MFMALALLFTRRPVRHEVALAGAMSLRGRVLPLSRRVTLR
jgi:ATP-dependent Lon protease